MTPGVTESERDERIHRLGNLTLLTKKLNSTVSNGQWSGEGGKAAHLQEKDVVLLNSKLLISHGAKPWDEAGVDLRARQTTEGVLAIWPVPPGHVVDWCLRIRLRKTVPLQKRLTRATTSARPCRARPGRSRRAVQVGFVG